MTDGPFHSSSEVRSAHSSSEVRSAHLTDEERYCFDLQGFLLLPGALGAEEVDACNRAVDVVSGTPAAAAGMLGWPKPHREPFRRLLIHPAVVAWLNELCGSRFRLDHGPRLLTGGDGTGAELQGGGEPFSPAAWYHQQNGRIFASAVTAAWQLAGEGGMCVVPGSHKAVEPAPAGVRVRRRSGRRHGRGPGAADAGRRPGAARRDHHARHAAGERRRVTGGSCCIPTRPARWSLTPAAAFLPEEVWGDWTRELTPEQRAVLHGPGVDAAGRLPLLESDGAVARVREPDRAPQGGTT